MSIGFKARECTETRSSVGPGVGVWRETILRGWPFASRMAARWVLEGDMVGLELGGFEL